MKIATLPLLLGLLLPLGAQQPSAKAPVPAAPPAPEARVYLTLCSSCHGPEMEGGLGPALLPFVRYHTDDEVTEVLTHKDSIFRNGDQYPNNPMPVYSLPDAELHELLSELRELAGTNPAMATGGFTGRSFTFENFGIKWVTPQPPAPLPPIPDFTPRHAVLSLVNGKTLAGTLMAQSADDAELLAPDGTYHLLARAGGKYRDKPLRPERDWLTYHGSLTGNRYSTLDQINRATVPKLAVAWKFPIPTSPRMEGTPLVDGGIMYVTGWNELFALDATTGSPIWSYRVPHTPGILGEAGRGSNRGVAVAGDRLFFVTDNAHLICFNRLTGQQLWEATLGPVQRSIMASSAPLVAGHLVLQGIGGGEEGARAFIDAYDVATGKHVWRFYTIPRRGEPAARTWVGQALEHGCGATWMTGSYDPALGLVYWGVGNPCPDGNGSQRLGDNLYTCSVVALNLKTGTLRWYFQFTPHDTHDWDSTESMILTDQTWQGKPRKLLLHGDRDGYFFVLDRTNGKLLLASPMSTKVTWTNGYRADGRPKLTPQWEATFQGTPTCPSGFGGTNWIDPSFDEQNHFFIVRATDSCGLYTAGVDPLSQVDRWTGGGKPSTASQQQLMKLSQGYKQGDYIRAIDIFTGKHVWDYPVKERSGVLATAGGLVFIGTPGGLAALDANTGKKLMTVDAGLPPTKGPVFAATPMTFLLGGKQYVVLNGMGMVVAYALTH